MKVQTIHMTVIRLIFGARQLASIGYAAAYDCSVAGWSIDVPMLFFVSEVEIEGEARKDERHYERREGDLTDFRVACLDPEW